MYEKCIAVEVVSGGNTTILGKLSILCLSVELKSMDGDRLSACDKVVYSQPMEA